MQVLGQQEESGGNHISFYSVWSVSFIRYHRKKKIKQKHCVSGTDGRSRSSVVSLSKALLSLWWQTDARGISTMTSRHGSAFEALRRRGACPRRAQVCAANGSPGGRVRRWRGGPPGLRHSTPSDGDEVSKAVDRPIVSSVCASDSEVFPQGGQVTHTQPLRRPSVEIIAAFTSVTPPPPSRHRLLQ